MTAKAILTDTTLCIGCEKCVEACRRENKLGEDKPRPWKMRIDDLSATRYTTIVRRPGSRFVRQQCRHCRQPACVSACLVGALQKTPEGPVIYDPDRCIGCRYCMMACPYGIPRYDWDKPVPYVRKCTLCYARLGQGREPACVEACPTKATIFGARDDLLAEAHRRIRRNPRKVHRQGGRRNRDRRHVGALHLRHPARLPRLEAGSRSHAAAGAHLGRRSRRSPRWSSGWAA